MKALQAGERKVYRCGVDVVPGKQYYVDDSGDDELVALLCTGAPGEIHAWIGTPLSESKAGRDAAFQKGGRVHCEVTGGVGAVVPGDLELTANGQLAVVTGVAGGEWVMGRLLDLLTGDATVTVDLFTEPRLRVAPPPSVTE